jgi:hypothetical protein
MKFEPQLEATLHAFAMWTVSAALLIGSMIIMPTETAVTIRLVTAPLLALIIATSYFSKPGFARPLPAALTFAAAVAALDAIVLGVIVERSARLFLEPRATWLPYLLILVTTWSTGAAMTSPRTPKEV